jgi:hypothetical protein
MTQPLLLLFFSTFLFILTVLQAKPEVTVWVRAFGEQSGALICPYLNDL